MKNAHEFPHIYNRLGIDLRELGCLMLDTESPVDNWSQQGEPYVSLDPKKFWVNGIADKWHVTVRFGFLPGVNRNDVNEVMRDLPKPTILNAIDVGTFPSPYPDEEYNCLVALVDSPELRNLNTALGVLPNVNTFPEYRPHITIGYFKPEKDYKLGLKTKIKTLDFNYGNKL